MTLTPLREHPVAPVPTAATRPRRPAQATVARRGRPAGSPGRPSVLALGPALNCPDAPAVITAASRQAPRGERPVQLNTPVRDVPLRNAPVRDISLRDISLRNAPVRNAPVRDVPMRNMPIRNTPVRDIPVRDSGGATPFAASLAAIAGMAAAPSAPAPALSHPPGTVKHVPDLVGTVLMASAVAAGVLAISRDSTWGRLFSRPPGRAGTSAGPPPGSPEIPRRHRAGGSRPGQAVPPAAVPLAATAQVRVAVASGREQRPAGFEHLSRSSATMRSDHAHR